MYHINLTIIHDFYICKPTPKKFTIYLIKFILLNFKMRHLHLCHQITTIYIFKVSHTTKFFFPDHTFLLYSELLSDLFKTNDMENLKLHQDGDLPITLKQIINGYKYAKGSTINDTYMYICENAFLQIFCKQKVNLPAQ